MDGFHYDWDDAEELDGNTIHIESAGVSQDEFQQVIEDPYALEFVSRSSGRPGKRGRTHEGRTLILIFEYLNLEDPTIIRPVTAWEE